MGLTTGFYPLKELVDRLTVDAEQEYDDGTTEMTVAIKHHCLRQTPSRGVLWVIRRSTGAGRHTLTLYEISYSPGSGYWRYRPRRHEESTFDAWLSDIPKSWGVPMHWYAQQRMEFFLGEKSAAQVEQKLAERLPKPEGDRNAMDHDDFFGSLRKFKERAEQ